MRPTTKRDQPKPKRQEAQNDKQANQRSKPKPKAKRSKKKDPRKQPKEELKATTQPPTHYESSDSCLGRSLVIPNVRKAQR
jgi:hypothetical protein